MGIKNTTVTKEVVYFGRRCQVITTHHDSKVVGLRTVRMLWLDDADERNGGHPAGTLVTRVVKGDGRQGDFEIYSECITDTSRPAGTVGIRLGEIDLFSEGDT